MLGAEASAVEGTAPAEQPTLWSCFGCPWAGQNVSLGPIFISKMSASDYDLMRSFLMLTFVTSERPWPRSQSAFERNKPTPRVLEGTLRKAT